MELGVQTRNIIKDTESAAGFRMLREAGFDCADFSLNAYLKNSDLYRNERNNFFDQTMQELESFFAPHKQASRQSGIKVHQMHMPYPNYVPGAPSELNDYLWNIVAPKSMKLCAYFECKYIVVHGFKLARNLGSEQAEWDRTEKFLDFLAPMAKEMGITICIENLYNSMGKHIVEGPCCDVHKVTERIDMMNEKYGAEVLGFCFDTGHANLVGLDFEDFLSTLGSRLKVLHIHDNDGIGDLHQLPFTFTQSRENRPSTDWEGFIKGLKAIHFDQVLSFETAPVLDAFPEEMKLKTLTFIADIGNYFKSKII